MFSCSLHCILLRSCPSSSADSVDNQESFCKAWQSGLLACPAAMLQPPCSSTLQIVQEAALRVSLLMLQC